MNSEEIERLIFQQATAHPREVTDKILVLLLSEKKKLLQQFRDEVIGLDGTTPEVIEALDGEDGLFNLLEVTYKDKLRAEQRDKLTKIEEEL